MPNNLVKIINAIDSGKLSLAREILKDELRNPTADLYYLASHVALDKQQRKQFLQKALDIDPFHERAYFALSALEVEQKPIPGKLLPITATSVSKIKKLFTLVDLPKPIHRLEFSRDGHILAAFGYTEPAITLLDIPTLSYRVITSPQTFLSDVCLNPTGKYLAFTFLDNGLLNSEIVQLWHAKTATRIFEKPVRGYQTGKPIAFSDNGQIFASVKNDNVMLWNAITGDEIAAISPGRTFLYCGGLVFSPNNSALAILLDRGEIQIWTLKEKVNRKIQVLTVQKSEDPRNKMCFTPSGDSLIFAETGGAPSKIRILNINTGKEILSLEGHNGTIEQLAISRDGSCLASAGGFTMITVYDHKDHQPYQNDLHPTWNDFTLSYETQDDWEPPDPPEEDVFDEVPENTIRIWDLRTGKQLQTIPIAYGSIRKFLLDRNLLCAVGEFREEQRVVLWDLRLANSFFELKCVDADLNPDGTLLALSQADGTIEFWGISDPSSSG